MGKLANYIRQRLCIHNWEPQGETTSGDVCFDRHIETYKCSKCGTIRQIVTIIPTVECAKLVDNLRENLC